MPRLTYLSVADSAVRGLCFPFLPTSLRSLDLSGSKVHQNSFNRIAEKKKKKSQYGSQVSWMSMQLLEPLSFLTSVSLIDCNRINSWKLAMVPCTTRLRNLTLPDGTGTHSQREAMHISN
jgi:hypothetical protein